MANTIKTLAAGDILRKALQVLHNNLVFCKTINRQYNDEFAQSGAKNGGAILIREPNQFTVRSGAVMDVQDVTESTQTLSVATQKGVDLNFTDLELTLSMDDFSTRILEPAVSRLAAEVDKTVIGACYKDVWNHQVTTFGTAPVYADVLAARALLSKGLAPTSDRFLLTEALSSNSIITDTKSLYNPTDAIGQAFNTGVLGKISGFEHYETEMIPTHTCGTRTDTTPVCDTTEAAGITSGTATVACTAFASGTTVTAGDVFTIVGVYAVNPETKAAYKHLQQFTVTADTTATTTTITIPVSPTPITSGAKQNISIPSAGSSSVSFLTPDDGSGAASGAYAQNLAYHRDAFTLATVDLMMPKDAHFAARDVMDGISMRIWQAGDITNDKFPCRLDVLFGYKTLRPEWACRLAYQVFMWGGG